MTDINAALADALLDRYRVERELGSGGMAIVYLAEDVKHRRKVALKVLRGELAATMGPERFLREIEVAAGLQHPHILPLHDSGEALGFLYYVMPFVDGHNLRHRISRQGELPIHEAVKILIEVTDALAYAHSQNVVHRDIKPENILLSGRHALVTDFGVAKAVSEATGRQALTTVGVALGTPAYMAPEQAAGEPNIDQRVDIYALGILGYELITGRTPFTGRTSQEVLAAHVTQPPVPLCQHRPACSAELEYVIMKCLAKRPADRWQTAEELLAQLEPLATPSGGTTPTTTRPMKSVSTAPGGFRFQALARRRGAAPRRGRIAGLRLEPSLARDPARAHGCRSRWPPDWSWIPRSLPTGRLVAFVTGPLFRTRLYVRQVEGGGNPVAITAEGQGFARMPRWSPDGAAAGLQLRPGNRADSCTGRHTSGAGTAPAGGTGSMRPGRRTENRSCTRWATRCWCERWMATTVRGLARLNEAHSCSWSPDGRRIACVSGNSQFVRNEDFGNVATSSIWVIPSAGGAPIRVTDDEWLNTSPAWLPGGSSLLYISNREGGRDLYQVDLGRSGRPAHEAVRLSTGLNAATVSVARTGNRLAYASFSRIANVWSIPIPRSGTVSLSRAQPVTTGSQEIEGFDPSPDGHWLAFDSNRGGAQQVYRMALPGGDVEQLTSGDTPSLAAALSFDGANWRFTVFGTVCARSS